MKTHKERNTSESTDAGRSLATLGLSLKTGDLPIKHLPTMTLIDT